MIIRNEQVTLLSDAEIANRRLRVILSHLERVRRERDALKQQNAVLKNSNEGLEHYAKIFHLNEEKEQENIAMAVESAEEDVLATEATSEYDDLEIISENVFDPDNDSF